MLRIYLPPNLASAAPRDAIPVKVELDLTSPPPPEYLPGLAVLQRLGAKPAATLFLQFTRAQLTDLLSALKGTPCFFWINQPGRPILWIGHLLRGVSDVLSVDVDKPTAPSTPPAREPRGLTSVPSRAPTVSRPRSTVGSILPLQVDGSEHYLAMGLPSREHASYTAAHELLKTSGFTLEPSNRKWWLRDRHRVLNFLASHGKLLREDFRAEFSENFDKNTAHLKTAEVVADAVEARDGFTLSIGLKAGRADESAIHAAVASNRGYIEDQGKIYLVDQTQLKRLGEAQRALSGDSGTQGLAGRRVHRLTSARLAEAQDILEEIAPGFEPPITWRARSEALRNLSRLQPISLPAPLGSLLRPYQHLGVAWLVHLYNHRLGGILADEMGLGKTLQALGLISAVLGGQTQLDVPATPCLVVCPASLLENWRREAARFAPHLRVHVHHGQRRAESADRFSGIQLLITSYGTLVRDIKTFQGLEFACVIADEAQHAKNRRSQNAQALRALEARGRCLLTGTPLENSLDDLRSLFEFLMPGFLKPLPPGLRGDDRAWYDERLRAQTAPYILRRTKSSVAPELPPKIEQVIWCEFTPSQAELYRSVHEQTERALLELETGGASEQAIRMATLTQLLRLRQVCCDPRLLKKSTSDEPATDDSAMDSAKLDAFRELLADALDEGHRLLVFSQFTSLLQLLRAELESQKIAFAYLDGAMSPRARQAEVDRFQSAERPPVFLLSLKAGGTGLNLTGADMVVHFDPWWNPAAEAQATDRAHRIGQTKVVTSYKLICSGSVEEKVLALQEEKRALLADVFEASDAAAAKLSLTDLRDLLR
ncbi:MAG TPA: DEAD/DEAH box helicase [Opitutaceae bacterium]|nr:DEAD/DEAH box helicase [Opitutaceae bacterium]